MHVWLKRPFENVRNISLEIKIFKICIIGIMIYIKKICLKFTSINMNLSVITKKSTWLEWQITTVTDCGSLRYDFFICNTCGRSNQKVTSDAVCQLFFPFYQL